MYKVDLRTLEGKTVTFVRRKLTEFVGGNSSPREIILIERAVWLSLRIALKEVKLLSQGPEAMTKHDDMHYLSWVNSLTKILDKLHPPKNDTTIDYTKVLSEVRALQQETA